jgi:hypothetical protein
MDFELRPGRRVMVDLAGKTLGGVLFGKGLLVAGEITVIDALGVTLKVKLDQPVGGGVTHGMFRRKYKPVEIVSVTTSQVALIDP